MANIKVAVRIRPFSRIETDRGDKNIVKVGHNSIEIANLQIKKNGFRKRRQKVYSFTFDHIFCSFMETQSGCYTQEQVYQTIKNNLFTDMSQGKDVCLLAYGQSGSGKTYTMMGLENEPGIIPRICSDLFSETETSDEGTLSESIIEVRLIAEALMTTDHDVFILSCTPFYVCLLGTSFFEIYNEKINDLLINCCQEKEMKKIRMIDHPKYGTQIPDLTYIRVNDGYSIHKIYQKGNRIRRKAETCSHKDSSRSHAIMIIRWIRSKREDQYDNQKDVREIAVQTSDSILIGLFKTFIKANVFKWSENRRKLNNNKCKEHHRGKNYFFYMFDSQYCTFPGSKRITWDFNNISTNFYVKERLLNSIASTALNSCFQLEIDNRISDKCHREQLINVKSRFPLFEKTFQHLHLYEFFLQLFKKQHLPQKRNYLEILKGQDGFNFPESFFPRIVMRLLCRNLSSELPSGPQNFNIHNCIKSIPFPIFQHKNMCRANFQFFYGKPKKDLIDIRPESQYNSKYGKVSDLTRALNLNSKSPNSLNYAQNESCSIGDATINCCFQTFNSSEGCATLSHNKNLNYFLLRNMLETMTVFRSNLCQTGKVKTLLNALPGNTKFAVPNGPNYQGQITSLARIDNTLSNMHNSKRINRDASLALFERMLKRESPAKLFHYKKRRKARRCGEEFPSLAMKKERLTNKLIRFCSHYNAEIPVTRNSHQPMSLLSALSCLLQTEISCQSNALRTADPVRSAEKRQELRTASSNDECDSIYEDILLDETVSSHSIRSFSSEEYSDYLLQIRKRIVTAAVAKK